MKLAARAPYNAQHLVSALAEPLDKATYRFACFLMLDPNKYSVSESGGGSLSIGWREPDQWG